MKGLGKLISLFLLSLLIIFITVGCGGEIQEPPEEESQASEDAKEENGDSEETSGEEDVTKEDESLDSKDFEETYFTSEVEVDPSLSDWMENKKYEAAVHQYPDNENLYMIAAGEKNTGGYSVVVTKEEFDGEMLTLYYKIQGPGPDDIVTQAITYPYLLVEICEDIDDVNFVKQ